MKNRWTIVLGDGTNSCIACSTRLSRIVEGSNYALMTRALQYALQLSCRRHILVTARSDEGDAWQRSGWFIASHRFFLRDPDVLTILPMAASLLAIAAESPSGIVTLLPAPWRVERISLLVDALDRAALAVAASHACVATLGMKNCHFSVDDDYLITGPESRSGGAVVHACARRPSPSAAKQLLQEGALVASGILVARASTFCSHIRRFWPTPGEALIQLTSQAAERREPVHLASGSQSTVLKPRGHSLPWSTATLPMRAFAVAGSGWSRAPEEKWPALGALPPDASSNPGVCNAFTNPVSSL